MSINWFLFTSRPIVGPLVLPRPISVTPTRMPLRALIFTLPLSLPNKIMLSLISDLNHKIAGQTTFTQPFLRPQKIAGTQEMNDANRASSFPGCFSLLFACERCLCAYIGSCSLSGMDKTFSTFMIPFYRRYHFASIRKFGIISTSQSLFYWIWGCMNNECILGFREAPVWLVLEFIWFLPASGNPHKSMSFTKTCLLKMDGSRTRRS